MANVCFYALKAVGESVNLWELIDLMQCKGVYQENGLRGITFDNEPKVSMENNHEAYLSGTCRWSVHFSMINEWSQKVHTLLSASKMLNLQVEVYGSGSGFQEHYLIEEGKVIAQEEVDAEEYFLPDLDAGELCDCIRENQLSGCDFLKHLDEETLLIGGFDDWNFCIEG